RRRSFAARVPRHRGGFPQARHRWRWSQQRRGGAAVQTKSEIRNPKSEVNSKAKIRNPKSEIRNKDIPCLCFGFRILCLVFLSDFGFRISDFGFRISRAAGEDFPRSG